jgi:tetratricopeptide (TPR) repeat protein
MAGDRDAALEHYRAVTRIDPADVRAHAAIADLASEHGNRQQAIYAVTARVPLERDAGVLRSLHYRLGALYADHDAASALSAFRRALTYRPGDKDCLSRITDLAIATADWQVALDACDQLVKAERDPDVLAVHLQRAATIFSQGLGDRKRAERMLQLAFDSAPTSPECLRLIVKFYKDADDTVSLRAQLNRIASAMRSRIAQDPRDGAAYRILGRAIAVRAESVVDGSLRIARAAAELAQLLGAGGDVEQRLIAARSQADVSRLLGPRSDEVVFSLAAQPEIRQIFRLAAQPIARHVGVDLSAHGVSRKDRLPAGDPVAAIARDVASSIGVKDVDVYVSGRDPYLMIAEPTSPVSLILGRTIASSDASTVRFAAAAVLKLAHMSLAIPARLSLDHLGVLGFTVLRLFRPELTSADVDLDEVNAQMPKLRKLIPPALFNEIKPHVRAVERFSPEAFARDLKIAGLRAGLFATESVVPGLAILAGASGADLPGILGQPIAQGLISFALQDARATTAT